MQALFALGQADHDVADAEDHRGQPLGKVPSGSALEGDAVAVEVGNFHPQDHLTERRLIGRAFHESLVEPGTEKQKYQGDAAA
jgi:hypothetical protein